MSTQSTTHHWEGSEEDFALRFATLILKEKKDQKTLADFFQAHKESSDCVGNVAQFFTLKFKDIMLSEVVKLKAQIDEKHCLNFMKSLQASSSTIDEKIKYCSLQSGQDQKILKADFCKKMMLKCQLF